VKGGAMPKQPNLIMTFNSERKWEGTLEIPPRVKKIAFYPLGDYCIMISEQNPQLNNKKRRSHD
jgi:hypothetical protein